MSPRLVIAGTDTDVGKTVVSALVTLGLEARYWKPVQCGLDADTGEGDRERVGRLAGLAPPRLLPEAYRLRAPVSPHWAAEQEGGEIEDQRLELPPGDGPLVVETAGGLLVPLRRDRLQIDQMVAWGLPVLLVARSGLGTLNHTLLSLEALASRDLRVLGLVLNGPPHPDNPRTLEQLGRVPVLLQLPPLAVLNGAALRRHWHNSALARSLRSSGEADAET